MLNSIDIEFRTFIFIVEFNSEFSRNIIEGLDIPKRATIRSFPSGEKFLEHFSTLKFRRNDLVIVFLGYNFIDDYNHTLMSGIEILEVIKKIDPKFEVVMMADEGEKEYGAYVMKLGAHTFIPKDDNIVIRANNIILRLCGVRNLKSKKRLLKIIFIVWLITLAMLIFSLLLTF